MPGLRPDQVQKIHQLIEEKKLIQAIALYREVTGVGLAEAKQAVEEMVRDEYTKPPDGVMDYDNPILEARIKSMLSKRQKIQAVKIYREEYGVGLKEAKDAVDRIERSMGGGASSSMNMPYESAIGGDPFAEGGGQDRRRIVALAVGVLVLLCGIGMFFLMMSF
jgi:ribosomal protein L7/L12